MAHPEALAGTLYAGRYELQELIATGGTSVVYRARDAALGRAVAIKLVVHGPRDAAAPDEAGLLAAVSHPSLVTLYDRVTPPDAPSGLVMQLVRGDDLRRRLQHGPLDPSAVAAIGRQIAEGLACLAAAGLVHQDVKPANILLQQEPDVHGRPVALLADLGIAESTRDGRRASDAALVGTARYLSPEQAGGGAVGPASDVYSLGLVLCEALTGRQTYAGTPEASASARLVRDPDIPASLPDGWRATLREMTRRDPARRLDARDVAARLAALETAAAVPAAREEPATAAIELPAAEHDARRPVSVAAALLGALRPGSVRAPRSGRRPRVEPSAPPPARPRA